MQYTLLMETNVFHSIVVIQELHYDSLNNFEVKLM